MGDNEETIEIEVEPQPYSRLIDERRLGSFRVDQALLRNSDDEQNLRLFANFIVVRAEYMFDTQCIEYIAYSPLFEPTPMHSMAPRYVIKYDGQNFMADKPS